MNGDELINIWEDSKQNRTSTNQKITKKMIENYLEQKVSKEYLSFNISILVTLLAFMASIIVLSINLYIYRDNPVMFNIETVLLTLSLLFFTYGMYVMIKLREINNFSKSLVELIKTRLKFLKSHYEIWLIALSIGMVILVFGVNTLFDNENGTYRINNVSNYLMVSLFVLGFVYSINKFVAFMSVKKMKLYLNDLQTGFVDNAIRDEKLDKKRIWIYIFVALVLTATLVLGILKLLREI